MEYLHRMTVASRAFTLAAVLGLGLALGNTDTVAVTVVVAAIAGLSAYLSTVTALPTHWAIAAEAGLASLIVVLTLPGSVLILPYLVVLPLVAGLTRGIIGASLVIGSQLGAMVTLTLTSGGLTALGDQYQLLAPWTLTIAGAGLLGAWVKKIGKAPPAAVADENYESARKLLGQLRNLARRLSSGLDPVAIAAQMLESVHDATGDIRSAVFTKTEGGVFAPLSYRGGDARTELDPNAPLIDQCWRTRRPAISAEGSVVHTTALPLRVGSGMVGVLVTTGPPAWATGQGSVDEGLLRELDELSLRLDTALAFDEVRNLVTADERQRLAREIHDGVAQEIASLGYVVDEIGTMAENPELADALKQLRGELSRVVNELRLSIFDLRTEVGNGSGLGSALSDYVRQVGARSAMTVHLSLDEATTRLTPGVETELFRIAQEAITNARKHSTGKNLWVDCHVHPPLATLTIRDDGAGLGTPRSDSYGLRIMRERAERIGATLAVTSNDPGSGRPGTCVTVAVGERRAQEMKEAGAIR